MSKKVRSGLTLQEIQEAEENAYIIQIGTELYNYDGCFVFDQKEAHRLYNNLLAKIKLTIKNGEKEDREVALRCVAKLFVLPLRIQ